MFFFSLGLNAQKHDIQIQLYADSASRPYLIQFGSVEITKEIKVKKKYYKRVYEQKLDSSLTFYITKDDSFATVFSVNCSSNTFYKNDYFHIDYKDSINYYPFFVHFSDNVKFQIDNRCPKCHKNDNLLKIVYGLGGGHENGEMPGGCMVSEDANYWYCKRCKLKY